MLVDTSVWIDFFNQTQTEESKYLASEIDRGGNIFICGVVLTEILMGFRSERSAEEIADTLLAFPLCQDLDGAGYGQAAALYRKCRSNGYTVRSTVDCIIAQICIRNNLPLLTRDRDFEIIAKNSELSVLGKHTFKYGFEPLLKRGVVVDNEMIDKIRDDEGL